MPSELEESLPSPKVALGHPTVTRITAPDRMFWREAVEVNEGTVLRRVFASITRLLGGRRRGATHTLGRRFEQTLYQDPNSPINQEFRGAAGVWPYGGGAVAVGFVDPKYGPNLPSVPEDDPHRTRPPGWLLEDQGEASPPDPEGQDAPPTVNL